MISLSGDEEKKTSMIKRRDSLRKILIFITLIASIATINPIYIFAENKVTEAPNIKIIIDEKVVDFEDVPIIINGRTMLPIRAVASNMGVPNDDRHIIWNGNEKTVTIYKDATVIELTENSLNANINGQSVVLDAAPFNYHKNNRVYIPVRFVAQALDKAVVWDQDTRSVYIHRILNQREMWEEMHTMVNSKVITLDEKSFNSKKIENGHVKELIAIAEKADYNDKAAIIEMLKRWENGDFRQCVEEHNYFWAKQRSYTTRTMTQEEMWTAIHSLANSKIIAGDDIYRGIAQIEQGQVNELIAIVENSNYDDKEILSDILYRWKNGDFRKCVDDHNYVWDRLHGEIGRAVRLMDDVQAAMANYIPPSYTGDSLGRDVGKAVSLTEEVKKAMESYTEPKA